MTLILLKSLLNTTAFYLLFKWLFAHSRFFTLNRIVLLCIPPLSLVLATVSLPERSETILTYNLGEVLVSMSENAEQTPISSDKTLWVYGFITLLFLFRLLVSLHRIQRIKQKATLIDGVYYTSEPLGVFSFMNSIFAYSGIREEDLKLMVAHERVHIAKQHSIDLLYYELWCALFWFMPALWLLKKELTRQHEFEADSRVTNQSNTEIYCRLLVKETLQLPYSNNLLHSFNQQPLLKTRIMMLTQIKPVSVWRYVSILPLSLLLAFVSANPSRTQAQDAQPMAEIMPEFPGGGEALMSFLQNNLKYPADVKAKKIEGRTILQFVVNKAGKVMDITILKTSGNTELDNEAMRVVKLMPDWKPGVDKGKKVNVKMTLPVSFKL